MKQITECKGMQLDTLMTLKAIFADADEYRVCEATRLEDLRQAHESFLEDEYNETVLKSLVGHPEASFTIQFTVPNEMGILNNADDMELYALVVLHMTLPPKYPNTAPTIQIVHDWCMVTDKNAVCSPDKPLEMLAFWDESKLQAALAEEIKGILPYPCVYEVGVTWLTESIFNYLELRVRAVLVNSTE
jgi:hypothetical protein